LDNNINETSEANNIYAIQDEIFNVIDSGEVLIKEEIVQLILKLISCKQIQTISYKRKFKKNSEKIHSFKTSSKLLSFALKVNCKFSKKQKNTEIQKIDNNSLILKHSFIHYINEKGNCIYKNYRIKIKLK